MSVSISNANLMYYYPFNTDSLNYASGTGVSDGSATNVSISNSFTKLTSGSFYFPGSSTSAFQIPNTTFNSNGITVMFWAKLAVLNPSAAVRIFDFGSGTGTYNFTCGFSNNAFAITFRGALLTTLTGKTNGSAYTVADTNWHHYCFTINSFPFTLIYVDGVQVTCLPDTGYPTLTTIAPCYIGKRTDGGTTYLNAYLNQFIMFNRVLSYTEINSIYLNPTGVQFVTSTPSSLIPLGSPLTINTTRLLAYYPLDIDILDYTTGTGVSNATAANASISTSATTMTSGSLYFTGSTTQSLSIKSLTFDGSGITVAFWMKCVTLPKASMTVFDFNATSGNFTINLNTNGYLGITTSSPSIQSSSTKYSFGFPIRDMNWHHYCITIETNGFIRYYVDGQDQFYVTYTALLYPAKITYTSCLLGSSNTSSNNTTYGTVNCYMNQFVVYNRVITSPELYAISKFPGYIQVSSSTSNVQTYYDTVVATKDIINTQPVTVNVQYSSLFFTPNKRYTLKNSALTTFGSALYTSCDLSFGIVGGSSFQGIQMTTDSAGKLYASSLNGTGPNYFNIYVYNSSGTLLNTLVRPGQTDSMVYDVSTNKIFMGYHSGYTNSISTYNVSTSTFTDVSYSTSTIPALAVSSTGVVYVMLNTATQGLYTIDFSTGTRTGIFTFATHPGNISFAEIYFNGGTFDASGNFYATSNGYIYKFSPNFSVISTLCHTPIAIITCDISTGNIYGVYGYGIYPDSIFKITPSGEVTLFYSATGHTFYTIHYDRYSNRLFAASETTIFRFNLQLPQNQVSYSFSSTSLAFGNNLMNLYDATNTVFGTQIILNVACFLEGTLIRCLDASLKREVYVPVEQLTAETYVKTRASGYKRVEVIGHTMIHNPNGNTKIDNRLFVYRAGKTNPTLFQDLYVTGNHCALVNDLSDDLKTLVREHMGDIYETEGQYRLPACLDERAEAFCEPGEHRIWHFAMEHDDVYANYGVLANGLLMESASIDYLRKHSKMTLTTLDL